jgi:hypothetical protein
MTTTIRQPHIAVTLNGTALTGVLAATARVGYTLRTSQAELIVRTLPAGLAPWQPVTIALGAGSGTVATRFTGYAVSCETELYPLGYKITCRGGLQRAAQMEAGSNVDFSFYRHGCKDERIVSILLGWTGSVDPATGWDGPVLPGIEGTGRRLGKVSSTPGFFWWAGETVLSFIEKLDAVCLGYRTFDAPTGIVRKQISMLPTGAPDWTFTEGVDIFRAGLADEILDARNRVIVDGYNGDYGSVNPNDRINFAVSAANPYLLNPDNTQAYYTHIFASNLIELKETMGWDTGEPVGLTCREVAEWLLAELNRRALRVTLTTYRDDPVLPGDVVEVVSPSRLGVNQLFWVQEVGTAINQQNQFTQTLTCIGAHA